MKSKLLIAAIVALASGNAFATGTHSGGHDEEMAIGKAGDPAKVSRTIDVTMMETDDGEMKFEPSVIQTKSGETIRLSFTNKGEVDHEFVMDTQEAVMEHKAVMEKNPDMEHADSNSLRLEPGKKGEIVWTFANAGDFTFACLIPGHYESGMHGAISVSK